MSTKDDGGHAFPADATTNLCSRGMSMRDYFAAQALASMAQHFPVDSESAHDCSVACYRFADAMLKRRDE
jgi:hypothetical protein